MGKNAWTQHIHPQEETNENFFACSDAFLNVGGRGRATDVTIPIHDSDARRQENPDLFQS
jgi:hypothetical protein